MAAKALLLVKCAIIILCSFSIISSLSIPKTEDYKKNNGHPWEQYESAYFFKFQNVDDIIAFADENFAPEQRTSMVYFEFVADIVRKRFYHGYSYYSMADNPIAFVAGKFTDGHLSAIVIPDDIMKHPMAACSQQAIVLMEVFKRKGVPFRKVEFNHHYTVEAKIENDWKYFDPDLEPNFENRRESITHLLASGRFDTVYNKPGINLSEVHMALGAPRFGKINQAPAPETSFLHRFTFFLNSKYVLFGALLLMIFSTVKIRKPRFRFTLSKSAA